MGEGWYKRFIGHHDDVLANCEAQVINQSQNKVSKEGIHILFWTMTKLMITEQLTADRVYNMDETGFQTHEKRRKVVAVRGSKNVWTKSISADFHLSLVAACSASGHIVPPTFILFGTRVKRDVLNNCAVPGATVTTTESGFINEKIFLQWINTFSCCIPGTVKRPIVLTFDGYSAHISLDVVTKALEVQILLVCLPPNAMHLLQPLDVAVFSTFKKHLRESIQKCMLSTSESNIGKAQAIQLASEAWIHGMLDSNCIAGFKATGLFPPNLVNMTGRFKLFKDGGLKYERKIEWLKFKEEICAEVLTLPPPTQKKRRRTTVDVGGRLLTRELLESLEDEKVQQKKQKKQRQPKNRKTNSSSTGTTNEMTVAIV